MPWRYRKGTGIRYRSGQPCQAIYPTYRRLKIISFKDQLAVYKKIPFMFNHHQHQRNGHARPLTAHTTNTARQGRHTIPHVTNLQHILPIPTDASTDHRRRARAARARARPPARAWLLARSFHIHITYHQYHLPATRWHPASTMYQPTIRPLTDVIDIDTVRLQCQRSTLPLPKIRHDTWPTAPPTDKIHKNIEGAYMLLPDQVCHLQNHHDRFNHRLAWPTPAGRLYVDDWKNAPNEHHPTITVQHNGACPMLHDDARVRACLAYHANICRQRHSRQHSLIWCNAACRFNHAMPCKDRPDEIRSTIIVQKDIIIHKIYIIIRSIKIQPHIHIQHHRQQQRYAARKQKSDGYIYTAHIQLHVSFHNIRYALFIAER